MTINFNYEKLKQLKKQYQNSVDNNVEVFTFDGHEILTSYAKYLIQYLESNLKK